MVARKKAAIPVAFAQTTIICFFVFAPFSLMALMMMMPKTKDASVSIVK
ncbi:hypothetical protein SRABI80_04785 [Peribacillus frigoritolerans]|nr:hypothetical protein SRABI80_04785 [Peribacillus frigoritolerans]